MLRTALLAAVRDCLAGLAEEIDGGGDDLDLGGPLTDVEKHVVSVLLEDLERTLDQRTASTADEPRDNMLRAVLARGASGGRIRDLVEVRQYVRNSPANPVLNMLEGEGLIQRVGRGVWAYRPRGQ